MVEELNEFTELQHAVIDAKDSLNLYTAEALSWLLVMGHTIEFDKGKRISFGKDEFKVMTFHAEGFKPDGELFKILLDKHPELVVPFYNAEMMHRHIELLMVPTVLEERHEEYVMKLNKAVDLMMSK